MRQSVKNKSKEKGGGVMETGELLTSDNRYKDYTDKTVRNAKASTAKLKHMLKSNKREVPRINSRSFNRPNARLLSNNH